MSKTTTLAIALLLASSSCGLFESSDEKRSDAVQPSGSGGVGAAAGGAGGLGGSTATGGSSAVGGAASECSGLPGPSMVEVPTPSGAKYCIDRTEVTQAQYKEFLAQTTATPGSDHKDCQDNKTYHPLEQPSSMEGANCIEGVAWTPDATPNRPVVCVDWCDAFAYCKWAGKRLCGKVGGGRVTLTEAKDASNPALDANQSQWFNACSQGGKALYPYGDSYDPMACEGLDASQDGDGGWLPKKDVAARPGCRGSEGAFVGVRDLSGSVAEFTDECMTWSSELLCSARGGLMGSPADELSCQSYGTVPPYWAGPTFGFRCCKDLP